MQIATETMNRPAVAVSDGKRYFQFSLLLLAAGVIYPLLYLRQNFENTLLEAFHITAADLGNFNSALGLIFTLTYIPSGWLADRFSPKKMVAFSVGAVGCLGFWYSTFPGYWAQMSIFVAWGLFTGLTFWSALIKAVNMIAHENEQGRFFGILDGGRGLVEAVLASAAVAIFAYYMAGTNDPQNGVHGFQVVIWMYSSACLLAAILTMLFLQDEMFVAGVGQNAKVAETSDKPLLKQTWQDLKAIFSIPQVWMMMFILMAGYMLFWATYSVSTYLQARYHETAVVAAFITMAKLWTRSIGGIGGGFLGDWLRKEPVLGTSMMLASIGLLCFTYLPTSAGRYVLLVLIIALGVVIYAIHGLYWSLLDGCGIPKRAIGLGIGVISMVGYSPDIFLPQINAALVSAYPGILGQQYYFVFIAIVGLVGAVLAFLFKPRKAS